MACRSVNEKRKLIRLVRGPDGHIRLDAAGRSDGRGAYVCHSQGCVEVALNKKLLERSLRSRLTEETTEELRAKVTQ